MLHGNEWWRLPPRGLATSIAAAILLLLVRYFAHRFIPEAFWDTKLKVGFEITYEDAADILFALVLALTTLLFLFVRRLRRYVGYSGRENAMMANANLIRKYLVEKSQELRSTRVAHWRLAEDSPGRQTFRNLLTEKITGGYPVKRLWQIKDKSDVAQLVRYLALYAPYDNYSLKVIVAKAVVIPELLCIGSRVASISLPEPSSPRELGRAFHFFGRREADAVARYFDILWDLAVPIKLSNRTFRENLESLAHQLPPDEPV